MVPQGFYGTIDLLKAGKHKQRLWGELVRTRIEFSRRNFVANVSLSAVYYDYAMYSELVL